MRNMYRVGKNLSNVKATYVSTEALAKVVQKDYNERFGQCEIEKVEKNTTNTCDFFYDAGGMCLANMPDSKVSYLGFTLGFSVDQASLLLTVLKDAKDRGGYVKIHGQWTCMCISTSLRNNLVKRLEEEAPKAEKIASDYLQEWEKRMDAKKSA